MLFRSGDGLDSHWNLLRNTAGGGQWFHKDGGFRTDAVGNGMQAGFVDQDSVCKCAVMIQDAYDCAMRAMAGESAVAGGTVMAGAVDFPDDTLSGEFSGARDTDKFVTKDSAEAHVALAKLQVGFADSGLQDIDRDFVAAGIRDGGVSSEVQAGVKNDGSHRSVPGCGC